MELGTEKVPPFTPILQSELAAEDIIILMCWLIWKQINAWIFNNEDPTPRKCKFILKQEFALLIKRTKKHYVTEMEQWLHI
jgi:hypothetical protein